MLSELTAVIVLDEHHLEEFKFAWKTWKMFKPELTEIPYTIVYDPKIEKNMSELSFLKNEVDYLRFDKIYQYNSQRDAMLTSFFEGISNIKTKNYLKIDTDCYATNYDNAWIKEIEDRDAYVIISSPWGYTKNPQRIINLENWGDSVDLFNGFQRLNLPFSPQSDKVIHSRIISYFYVGNTEWTNKVSSYCWDGEKYVLPDPSQDTFMWYCAERLREPIKKRRFKKFGFSHTKLHKIKKEFELIGLKDKVLEQL